MCRGAGKKEFGWPLQRRLIRQILPISLLPPVSRQLLLPIAATGYAYLSVGGADTAKERWEVFVARFFLAGVGALYAYLAAWCSFSPGETSSLVGFTLQPGSGQSEFLVVYGGLELGMALIFLWPLLRPETTRFALINCTLIHACLVAFRTVSFALFAGIQPMTWKLAAGEWVIFLAGAGLLWVTRNRAR
jgi:hypothetical protein